MSTEQESRGKVMKSLSVIIPCYNEGKTIKQNIQLVRDYLDNKELDYEIIAVNDCSKDNTLEELNSINGIKVVDYSPNGGKGFAVKQGILASTKDYVLFMDADLSTDLKSIDDVLTNCDDFDVIMGTRHAKKSTIVVKQPFLRRVISFGCRKLVNLLFHFHYTDTQCGFKEMNRETALCVANKQIINNFAFDVEYLYIAKLLGKSVKEIPVVWKNDDSSTVSPLKSSIKFFKDLHIIKKHKKHYLGIEKSKK